MRCLLCESFSLFHICEKCRRNLLSPSFFERELEGGLKVYSFYRYGEIESLLETKHTFMGYFIYKALAKASFLKFARDFQADIPIYAIGIDDYPQFGYSHTALLAKALKGKNIYPIFNSLIALNRVKYRGKSLEFRVKNPRNFRYSFKKNINAILVDDVVTTGLTLKEAEKTLKKEGVKVLFALTLADAREK
ncbi:MAG: ComF family protein [Epsilonproteobacteria bacterium]|nr:ComF family protein [Campylobacterota bacterium]